MPKIKKESKLLEKFIRDLISFKLWFAVLATVLLFKGLITGYLWVMAILSLLGARQYGREKFEQRRFKEDFGGRVD